MPGNAIAVRDAAPDAAPLVFERDGTVFTLAQQFGQQKPAATGGEGR